MAIITIARELAALGEEVARELSRITDYKLIDREYLEKRLSDYGLDAGKREKYDEKKPGFWASLSQERDDYLHFLKTALLRGDHRRRVHRRGQGRGGRSSSRSRASSPSSWCRPSPSASSAS